MDLGSAFDHSAKQSTAKEDERREMSTYGFGQQEGRRGIAMIPV
jgi:hypothetical protein